MRTHVGAIGAIIGAVVTVVLLAILFSEPNPTTGTHVAEVVLIVLGVSLTLTAVGLFVLAHRVLPRLHIGGPEVVTVAGPGGSSPVDVGRLRVANRPRRGATRANGVYVRLIFFTPDDGAAVHSAWAQWTSAPSPAPSPAPAPAPAPGEPGQADVAPQVDIPADGPGAQVDVVRKDPGQARCQAVSRSAAGQEASVPLEADPVLVQVVARGSNAKAASAWFEVTSGPGAQLSLAPTANPGW